MNGQDSRNNLENISAINTKHFLATRCAAIFVEMFPDRFSFTADGVPTDNDNPVADYFGWIGYFSGIKGCSFEIRLRLGFSQAWGFYDFLGSMAVGGFGCSDQKKAAGVLHALADTLKESR